MTISRQQSPKPTFLLTQLWARVPHLDRYLLAELSKPFLFGVGIFSAIGVAAGSLFTVLQEVTAGKIPLSLALQVLFLQVPRFMTLALPMAMLLASLLAIARLSGDRELTALKACGVGLGRLLLPIMLFGLFVSGLMFGLDESVVPFTQYQTQVLMQQPLMNDKLNFQDQNVFYQEYGDDREVRRFFYAKEFNGQSMEGLTILDFTQQGINQIIAAQSAEWDADESRWSFRNGKTYLVSADGKTQNVFSFQDQQLYVPRDPLDLAAPRQNLEDMSIADAKSYQVYMAKTGNSYRVMRAELQIQRQIALPFITVIFATIGTALGSTFRGMSNSNGLGLSILFVLGYYLLDFISLILGKMQILAPLTAAWLPNLLTILLAGLLLYRAGKVAY